MAGVETVPASCASARAGARQATSNERRRLSTKERPVGRYNYKLHGSQADTFTPEDGVGRPVHATRRRETVLAAVDDPYRDRRQTAPKRIQVAVNSRVDLLENERAHKLISEAAYRTGRLIQAIFELLGRLASPNTAGTSRSDPVLARQQRIERNVDMAKLIAREEARIRERVGMIDTRLLRRILGDRLSYAECAGLQGKSGDRGQRYIAQRFRDALETLAEAYAAKGATTRAPDDTYRDVAVGASERQAASLLARCEAALDGARVAGNPEAIAALELEAAILRSRIRG